MKRSLLEASEKDLLGKRFVENEVNKYQHESMNSHSAVNISWKADFAQGNNDELVHHQFSSNPPKAKRTRQQYPEDRRKQAFISILTGSLRYDQATQHYGIPKPILQQDLSKLASKLRISLPALKKMCNQYVSNPIKSYEEVYNIVSNHLTLKKKGKPSYFLDVETRAIIALTFEAQENLGHKCKTDHDRKAMIKLLIDNYVNFIKLQNNGFDNELSRNLRALNITDNFMLCNFSDSILNDCVPGVRGLWTKDSEGNPTKSSYSNIDQLINTSLHENKKDEKLMAQPGCEMYTYMMRQRLKKLLNIDGK